MPPLRPRGATVTHPQGLEPAFPTTNRSGRPGRRSAGTGLYHGKWWDLHQDDTYDQLMAGRFTRLIPVGAEFAEDDLQQLADKMTATQEPTPTPEGKRDPEEDP